MTSPSLLVLGGNGFLGSHICRAALPHFARVTSLSPSGAPPASSSTTTTKEHAWVDQVAWTKGDVFTDLPQDLLASSDAVVSTLGVLLEGDYKSSPAAFFNQLWRSRTYQNPLAQTGRQPGSTYQRLNHDAALEAYRAYQRATGPDGARRAFVYLSAEDTFRPLIPPGYIRSKRQAEADLTSAMRRPHEPIKPYFLRPSLIVHPDERPLTKVAERLLGASALLQSTLPLALRARAHADFLAWLTSHPDTKPHPLALEPAYKSLANLISIPPVPVDVVAQAAVHAVLQRLQDDKVGSEPQVVGVEQMQAMQQQQHTRGRASYSRAGAS